ncbi:MAG: DUF427 domain-containing protein [Sciscionella sp.]
MTLTLGGGPLSGNPPATANYRIEGPAHKLLAHPFPRRVRAVLGGETILDTEGGLLLHETGLLPQLYLPEEDLRGDLLEPSEHGTHCPFKGDATYRSVRVGDMVAENAVWSYPRPIAEAAWLSGYAAVYWSSMDSWLDEDDEVFGHLRDPYHRVDVRPSSRRVTVLVGGEVLAESDHPLLLSETGLPNRWYLPGEDVLVPLLRPTDTETVCPYKGTASYVAFRDEQDVGWTYPHPVTEAVTIAGHYCFDPRKVSVEVDGVQIG